MVAVSLDADSVQCALLLDLEQHKQDRNLPGSHQQHLVVYCHTGDLQHGLMCHTAQGRASFPAYKKQLQLSGTKGAILVSVMLI